MKLYIVNYWNGDCDETIYRTLHKTLADMVCKEANNFLGYQMYEVEEFELEAPVYKITCKYHNAWEGKKWFFKKDINNKPECISNTDTLVSSEEIKP